MPIDYPPRLQIANLPTAIHPLDRLSAMWGGPRIWIKRDDDTGGVITGNKIRKLQYVVREALDAGADTLITCGGIQSNHCRATAAVGARLGLKVVLCLRVRGEPPDRLEGNLLLDRVLGAEVRHITPEQYAEHTSYMEGVAQELREDGRKPFVIAEGASMAAGTWGYIEACEEIANAERELGVTFDSIVSAVGSGGTTAGIELGVRLVGLKARPLGIPVCDDAAYFRPLIHRIAHEAIDTYGHGVDLPVDAIDLVDGYVGDGYAISTEDELRFLVDVARREGVVLDPVYSGKAFRGLHHEIRAGRFSDAHNVLFLHTGGVFGLLPKTEQIPLD
jgi:D-cysteine desulfhydrase